MRLQLQMAGDLSKLVSFSKLKWQVTFIILLFCFWALLVLGFLLLFCSNRCPCWQRHKAPKAWILARLLANLLISQNNLFPLLAPDSKHHEKLKLTLRTCINEMASRARLIIVK